MGDSDKDYSDKDYSLKALLNQYLESEAITMEDAVANLSSTLAKEVDDGSRIPWLSPKVQIRTAQTFLTLTPGEIECAHLERDENWVYEMNPRFPDLGTWRKNAKSNNEYTRSCRVVEFPRSK